MFCTYMLHEYKLQILKHNQINRPISIITVQYKTSATAKDKILQ